MATKDISDLQVVLAYLVARETRELPTAEWPYQILQRITDQCEKVCYRACERAERRGYIDCGVSLRSGWVTEKGMELVEQACAERGVAVPPELRSAPPKPEPSLSARMMPSILAAPSILTYIATGKP